MPIPVLPAYDEVGAIIRYEAGELDAEETIALFQHLVANGHAWQLQGNYGRTAWRFIRSGHVMASQ